jgi:hypothetical protein
MGVFGGLPLTVLFIAILVKAFSAIGKALPPKSDPDAASHFAVWALGSALFAHAVTFVSVAYFDQTVIFLYLTVAAASGLERAGAAVPTAAFAQSRRARRFVYRSRGRLGAPAALGAEDR